jgi:hypothetical protein
MSLRYRATLIDPADTTSKRPVQTFAMNYQDVEKWAETVLANAVAEDACVKIYETTELLIRLVPKPRKSPLK